jgi:hypothetical protein
MTHATSGTLGTDHALQHTRHLYCRPLANPPRGRNAASIEAAAMARNESAPPAAWRAHRNQRDVRRASRPAILTEAPIPESRLATLVRLHKSTRVTPAMAANVTDRLWSLEELVERTSN